MKKRNKRVQMVAAGLLMAAVLAPGAFDGVLADEWTDADAAAEAELGDSWQEGEDFASSWDDILDESADDGWTGEALEDAFEDPGQDSAYGQGEEYGVADASQEAEPELAGEADGLNADFLGSGAADEASDPVSGGTDILDGMEPGPTAQELQDETQARALEFLQAPYVVLERADPDRIAETLEELTKIASPTGSDGELEIGQVIMDALEALGYHVTYQNFHEDYLNEDLVDVPGVNILAEREVNDANPTDEVLLVITHYDSKTMPEESDPFANDKTGAAVLLETARLLAREKTVTDVCFVFLSGEEDGFYGSRSFLEGIEPFLDKIIGVICVGTNGYTQKITIPLEDGQEQVIETGIPAALETPEGNENRAADLLLTAAAVQKLALLSGIESTWQDGEASGSSGSDAAGAEPSADAGSTDIGKKSRQSAAADGSLDWKIVEDPGSSASVFAQAELETVVLRQQTSEITAGTGLETVSVETDPQLLAHNADVLARTVGMYMAGLR